MSSYGGFLANGGKNGYVSLKYRWQETSDTDYDSSQCRIAPHLQSMTIGQVPRMLACPSSTAFRLQAFSTSPSASMLMRHGTMQPKDIPRSVALFQTNKESANLKMTDTIRRGPVGSTLPRSSPSQAVARISTRWTSGSLPLPSSTVPRKSSLPPRNSLWRAGLSSTAICPIN